MSPWRTGKNWISSNLGAPHRQTAAGSPALTGGAFSLGAAGGALTSRMADIADGWGDADACAAILPRNVTNLRLSNAFRTTAPARLSECPAGRSARACPAIGL